MIIECPCCNTKFSVDVDLLADIEDPRFHCCRCDNYFRPAEHQEQAGVDNSTAENESLKELLGGISKKQDSKEQASEEQQTVEDAPHSDWSPSLEAGEEEVLKEHLSQNASAEQLTLLPEEHPDKNLVMEQNSQNPPSIPDPDAPFVLGEPHTWLVSNTQEPTKKESPESGSWTAQWPTDTTSSETGGWQRPVTRNSKRLADYLSPEPREPLTPRGGRVSQLLAQARTRDPEASSRQVRPPSRKTVLEESGPASVGVLKREMKWAERRASKQQRYIKEMEEKKKKEERTKEEKIKKQERSEPQSLQAALRKMPKLKLPRAKAASIPRVVLGQRPQLRPESAPVLFFCSVPLAVLLLLSIGAANIEHIPQPVTSLLHLDTSHVPRVPPEGLGLTDLSTSLVTLDNGKQVLEVKGAMLNGTTRAFKRLTIEASLFDKENHLVESFEIDPFNELQDAKLAALDLDVIEKLQGRPLKDSGELQPSKKIDFRLVIPVPGEKTRWFSARILKVFPE